MTQALIADLAARRVFHPRSQFVLLAEDHVPFDRLAGRAVYETAALRTLTSDATTVAVRGGVGTGKSSLIAALCRALPPTHVALRVPVVGADDPTSVSVVAALTLSTALNAIEMERSQREALERARADELMTTPKQTRSGGTLGGGPVPVEVHAELETLTTQLGNRQLAGERLAGLDRLISILVSRGLTPVFVLEDTEAAVGGREREEVAEAFFAGPVAAFMQEIEAPMLIAVQEVLTEAASFRRLAPSMHLIELPAFDRIHAAQALKAIAQHRLDAHDMATPVERVVAADAVEALVSVYHEADQSFRVTLAVLQSSVEHTADDGAARLGAVHVRAGAGEWGRQV